MPTPSTIDLLTVEDLAAWFKVRKRKIYDLVHNKGLPHIRIGRFLRFIPAEVIRWLVAQLEVVPPPGGFNRLR